MKEVSKYADYLISWLEDKRENYYQMQGYVLGVSGGIDSAVVAGLLALTKKPVSCLILPALVSQNEDIEDAKAVLETFNLNYQIISIDTAYQAVIANFAAFFGDEQERIGVLRGNLMARLRMVYLYTLAQAQKAIVVGTDNLAEYHTGYFTKFGDGAADVFPLHKLRKEEVRQLAKHLGVPEKIITKSPSAGLWAGQTDEGEMGVSYQDLDAYLRGEKVSANALERINFWHNRSHHKRVMPLTPLKPEEI